MADRLISADALKKAILHRLVCYPLNAKMPLSYNETDLPDIIDQQATIEAEPVKHGRWIFDGGKTYCSECGYNPKSMGVWDYCPVCGARCL